LEREAGRLLKLADKGSATPKWRKDADSVWGFIKEMAGDIFQGGKAVMKDLGPMTAFL